ncbi:5-(carboxyamino)imidazole ribonucleotide synthase [Pseudorhodoferax sp.]|uniref:5-(carboxyamino)imidazole ribonucleotide synthase n=1 Tax=Pseudorhodoferax sp. TaxID=1993553 RepID=UPI002DD631AF|nr:5-(carboxyamino)imidazole ribonucleotide synthase [Pseudorhodoferax sp.]
MSRTLARVRTVGVLGGGQLGRMFVHAAQRGGLGVVVLDPDASGPAARAADQVLCAAYDDPVALASLAAACVAVTTEFENVPAASLQALARLVGPAAVSPGAEAVRICQHRALEKAHFQRSGVACAPFAVIESEAQLQAALTQSGLLPGILKTSQLGYDGKGQVRVADADALVAAWHRLGRRPCVLEALVPIRFELSVLVARGGDGAAVHLPVQQNLHRDGILAVTRVPAPDADAATRERVVAMALQLAETMAYVGVLCVEFFVLDDGRVLANEMAPRPHNSGHYSIDACDVSQFELQLRTLLGQPLVAPRLHSPAVMLNLLGDLWFDGSAAAPREPDWAAVQALPGVHLHLYGKAEARPGRKMGHLTVTAATAAEALAVARQVAGRLGLPQP